MQSARNAVAWLYSPPGVFAQIVLYRALLLWGHTRPIVVMGVVVAALGALQCLRCFAWLLGASWRLACRLPGRGSPSGP